MVGRVQGCVLRSRGPEASEVMSKALVTNLALGHGPRQTAREIRDALDGNLARALTDPGMASK